MTTSSRDDSILCQAHRCSTVIQQELSEIPLASFADHAHLIYRLDFSNNLLRSLPTDFFDHFPSSRFLNLSHNQLETLPLGIGRCAALQFLDLSFNGISSLPDDFADVMKSVQYLYLSGNPLFRLPGFILSSGVLQQLYADQIGLEDLPDACPQHSELTVLSLADNAICRLPPSLANLTQLEILDLTGVRWMEPTDSKTSVTLSAFSTFVNANPLLQRVDKKVCNSDCCCLYYV